MVHVDLLVSKTQQFPGPLAEFAADYVGIDDVITKSAVNYAIENAAIFSTTEADPRPGLPDRKRGEIIRGDLDFIREISLRC